ncbi:MAG: heparinase II/III family protein [Parvularculales bacterium]
MPDLGITGPPSLRSGQADIAESIVRGVYLLPGGRVDTQGQSPFSVRPPDRLWAESLNGFNWLTHCATADSDKARVIARHCVSDWVDRCGRWEAVAWEPHIIGRRLLSWFTHTHLLIQNTEMVYRSKVIRSMGQQARHLTRVANGAPSGLPRLTAAMGVVLSGLCLSGGAKRIPIGLDLMKRELQGQILPDGVHASRNPALHLDVLLDLVSIEKAFALAGRTSPEFLKESIRRLSLMVQFFLHSDGRLAVFQGGNECWADEIKAVLPQGNGSQIPSSGFAPWAGYQRLQGGETVVLVETGSGEVASKQVPAVVPRLAFEMSAGTDRIIVNCGNTSFFGHKWAEAMWLPSALSTLTMNTQSTGLGSMGVGRFAFRGAVTRRSRPAECLFHQDETGVWTDATRVRGGVVHRRRLFLTSEGDSLRGQDILSSSVQRSGRSVKGEAVPFTIRFHVHPSCRASLAAGGQSVLIAPEHGMGWRFIARCGEVPIAITLEGGVYVGEGAGEHIRRTHQIVVTSKTLSNIQSDTQIIIKWMFQKLERRPFDKVVSASSEQDGCQFSLDFGEPDLKKNKNAQF